MVAAQGLDSLRPFSSQAEHDFLPPAVEVILQGKSLRAEIRYICWPYLSGYNLLKELVTGHLLCVETYCCLRVPPRRRCWIRDKCVNLGQMFSSRTFLQFTLLFLLPWRLSLPSLGLHLIHATPSPDNISARTKRHPWRVWHNCLFFSAARAKAIFPTTPHHIIRSWSIVITALSTQKAKKSF